MGSGVRQRIMIHSGPMLRYAAELELSSKVPGPEGTCRPHFAARGWDSGLGTRALLANMPKLEMRARGAPKSACPFGSEAEGRSPAK